jgi:hypothetical protein
VTPPGKPPRDPGTPPRDPGTPPRDPGTPPRDPGDPGFWRRPLSNRVVWTIIAIAAVVVVAGAVLSLSLGVRLF